MAAIVVTILIVLGFIVLLIFLAKLRAKKRQSRNERLGREGEEYINEILLRAFANTDAKLICGYMFQGCDLTVQIDHLLIDTNGVFVIETKNWAGQIYGSESDGKWTQVLANGKKRHQHQNPVKQNTGHIYQLSKILPYGIPFHNIVVMAKGNVENITANGVVPPVELVSAICQTQTDKTLTSSEIKNIYSILMQRAITGDGTDKKHVKDINQMLSDVDKNICPRCKGRLVLREGNYGKFLGCSNYPKCTFKKKL